MGVGLSGLDHCNAALDTVFGGFDLGLGFQRWNFNQDSCRVAKGQSRLSGKWPRM